MSNLLRSSVSRLRTAVAFVATMSLVPSMLAQVPAHRLSSSFNASSSVELPNTFNHRTASATDIGHLDSSTKLGHMTLVLKPTASQDTALTQLLADQQNPSSAQYHKWLSPTEFGQRFGVSDADLSVLKQWLQSAGFQVESVPESRNAIVFSGSSSQVESAFHVKMERYSRNGQQYFQNASNISVPSAFADIVSGVGSLTNFRAKHMSQKVAVANSSTVRPMDTESTTSGTVHYLSPWDFQQIYGMRSLISNGYNGAGISIAVLGQSYVSTTQLGYFQTLTGQTVKAPNMVPVSATYAKTTVSGDQGESEVDLEYTSGTAPGATIYFVYDADPNSNGVFDALFYAITNKTAPILSMSYGTCEVDEATPSSSTQSSDISQIEPYLRQANAQGQTLVVSAGDWNAATCDEIRAGGDFTTATQGATVSYPASSPYATGIGGTTFNEGTGTSYWASSNNAYRGSAQSYIPEVVWNETASAGSVLGTGGGKSSVFSKPSWQVATNMPDDGRRDVPDIAFSSAVYHDPYLYCSGEATSEQCTSTSFPSYRIGGTSLAAPNFAAMLAVIEQANGGTALGNINPLLYSIAASSSSAYQDVTSGNNQVACETGTQDCTNGTLGYTAGVGYDQTTGLGSVNATVLSGALSTAVTATKSASSISLVQNNVSYPGTGQSITYTAYVSGSGSVAPTGSLSFVVDGGSAQSATLTAGSNGTSSGTLTTSFSTTGTHTVAVTYLGDGNYTSSSSSITVTVTAPLSGSFTLATSPSTLSITSGSSGKETVTITSTGGFADTVNFSGTYSSSSTVTLCGDILNTPVTAGGTATATLTLYTSASVCSSSSSAKRMPLVFTRVAQNDPPRPFRKAPFIVFAGLLIGCIGVRRHRALRGLLVVCLAAASFGMIGCGSSGTNASSTGSSSSGATITFKLVGTSSKVTTSYANVTANSTFTINIQ